MYVVVSTSFIAILFAFLSRYKNFKYGLEWGFVIVTFIACIHYNYGNDYENYYLLWSDIKGTPFQRLFSSGFHAENGWVFINWIFGFKGGFYWFVALLSVIQNYIYYRLIKSFVPRNWYWLSLLLYLCDTSLYVLNFSLMRQGLTVSLFIAAFLLINNKKYILSVILLLSTIFIHRSAWICLPLLLIPLFSRRRIKLYIVLILVLTVVLFFFQDTVATVYDTAISIEEFEKYQNYENRLSSDSLGIGFLLGAIPYVIMIYYLFRWNTKLSKEVQLLLILSFLSLLLVPFRLYTQSIVSRVGIYFSAFIVASIPWMYSNIKDVLFRAGLTMIVVFLTLYSYFHFFSSISYRSYYLTFHSIFELI